MTNIRRTKIIDGDHFADILVRHGEGEAPVYYWICQKFQEGAILGMGAALTFEDASFEAEECLERLESGHDVTKTTDPLRSRVN
jgi:hypothetical protein